jgi:hypothetical protein
LVAALEVNDAVSGQEFIEAHVAACRINMVGKWCNVKSVTFEKKFIMPREANTP